MEKITFSLNLKMDNFIKHWEKWIQYIKPLRPDFVKIMHWRIFFSFNFIICFCFYILYFIYLFQVNYLLYVISSLQYVHEWVKSYCCSYFLSLWMYIVTGLSLLLLFSLPSYEQKEVDYKLITKEEKGGWETIYVGTPNSGNVLLLFFFSFFTLYNTEIYS